MVGRSQARSGGIVWPVADNGAGQDGDWVGLGQRNRIALAETWASLAEVCRGLSDTEWALPTECPGWSVKDQLSHLIGIEQAIMGDPAPAWSEPLGEHVRNDFAATNEPYVAVRRAEPGAAVRAEFVAVTATRLDQLDELTAAEWSAIGWGPLGQVPHRGLLTARG